MREKEDLYKLYYLNPTSKKRIYEIGNYDHNTFEPKMYDTMEMGDLANNPYNSPPAGITTVSSGTEGSLGAIKRTTVNFIVHNFHDFQSIYSKFFLKPGAQIFLDFGWNNVILYKPIDIIDDTLRGQTDRGDDLYEALYGEDGYVTESNGDLETLFGFVTKFDSKLRNDGGFDCSVEIVSQNNALLDFAYDKRDDFKTKFTSGLSTYIINLVASAVEKQGMGGFLRSNWLASPDNLEESALYANSWAYAALSSTTEQTTENGYTKKAGYVSIDKFPLLAGVYWQATGNEYRIGSNFTAVDNLFISWAFFEDEILNKELQFDANEHISFGGDGEFTTKFTSVGSYVMYSTDLFKSQRIQTNFESGNKTKLKFLYPDHWEPGYTYDTINKKGLFTQKKIKKESTSTEESPTSGKVGIKSEVEEKLIKKYNLKHKDYKPSWARITDEYKHHFLTPEVDDEEIMKAIENGSFIFVPGAAYSDQGAQVDAYNAEGYGEFKRVRLDPEVVKFQEISGEFAGGETTAQTGKSPDKVENKTYVDAKIKEVEDENTIVTLSENGELSGPSETPITNGDKETEKIPLRELFINVTVIKNAFSRNDNINDAIKQILDEINEASFNIFDLGIIDSKGDGTKLSIVDKNLSSETDDVFHTTDLNGIFTFAINTPNSIVKSIDMTYQTPTNGLQNMIAIQNGSVESIFPNSGGPGSDDQNNSIRIIENMDTFDRTFFNYLPGISNSNLINKKINTSGDTDDTKKFDNSILQVDSANLSKLKSFDAVLNNVSNLISQAKVTSEPFEKIDGNNNILKYHPMLTGEESKINLADFVVDVPAGVDKIPPQNDINTVTSIKDVIYANSLEDYFSARVRKKFFSEKTPSIIPIDLSLTIHGTTGIKPGNIFTVNYLPAKYQAATFFQVTAVSQEVSQETWSTTINGVMRIKPIAKKAKGKLYYANPNRVRMSDKWVYNNSFGFWGEYRGDFTDFYLMYDFEHVIGQQAPFFWKAKAKQDIAGVGMYWKCWVERSGYLPTQSGEEFKLEAGVNNQTKNITVNAGESVYIVQDMSFFNHNFTKSAGVGKTPKLNVLIIKEDMVSDSEKLKNAGVDSIGSVKFLKKLYLDIEFIKKLFNYDFKKYN